MDITFSGTKISFIKVLNSLDVFTIDFCEVLTRLNISYVLISGYVSILFGRNRASEDIDIFIEHLSFDRFKQLWEHLDVSFECLNTVKPDEAYHTYLDNGTALRFSKKGRFIPNMEMKFPTAMGEYALKNKVKVILGEHTLYISPLELQIAYKLFLGSEKDIEDARFLFVLFKEKLDQAKLDGFFNKLNIPEKIIRLIQ